jgi:hypothetical protein
MVTTKPFMVLVCLLIISVALLTPFRIAHAAPDNAGVLGIQGDALSADPTYSSHKPHVRTKQPERHYSSAPTGKSVSDYPSSKPVSVTVLPSGPSVGFCPPQGPCPPQAPCPQQEGGIFGLFTGGGISLGSFGPVYLPRQGCKQFQINAKLWYASMDSSKVLWGANPVADPGTRLDLNSDLGLPKRQYLAEYEARCQLKPNWGLRYSFMPINFRANFFPNNFFYFGNVFYPMGYSTLTQWDRYIQRLDLVYDWFQGCQATSGVFAGYAVYDDKITVSNILQSRSRSQLFGLAYAGMSIERAFRDLYGKATASFNCKWSAQFLEGYFGWDGYTAMRIAVPFEMGRFGYLEAGWRWIVLQREYPTNVDTTNLNGIIGTVGLVF